MSASESKPPLRTLFDSLTSLESREARDEFLDFTCRDHPELRARLEHLAKLARLEDMMLTTHANTSASNQHERNLGAWREFAIGLMEYRKGNRGGRTG
jgi:hypothetical protein